MNHKQAIKKMIHLLENYDYEKFRPLSNANIKIDSKDRLKEKYWIDFYKDQLLDYPVAYQAGHRDGFCKITTIYPEISDEIDQVPTDSKNHLGNIQALEYQTGFRMGQSDWLDSRQKFLDWADSYSASLVAYDSVLRRR